MGYFKGAIIFGIFAVGFYFVAISRHSLVVKNINSTYDYIVVGAGSAGAVLAARLSEDEGKSVLVIEAGNEDTNILPHVPFMGALYQNTSLDWSYYTEPQTHSSFASLYGQNRSFWPRGKVLGGSSILNAMAYVRGNKADYDEWAENGCFGWGYDDVLPYFLKSEDILIPGISNTKFHHKGGPLAVSYANQTRIPHIFAEAGKELGYKEVDYNGEEQEGFSTLQSTIRGGVRSSTSREFLHPAMKRTNLHVAVNTHATKVLIDDNKRAVGVEFIRVGTIGTVKAKKEVILSAGSINSPQILMLSGIGPRKHLESLNIPVVSDLPVGQNLQDHLMLWIGSEINTTDSISMHPLSILTELVKYFLIGQGAVSSSSLEGTAFINTDKRGEKKKHTNPYVVSYNFKENDEAKPRTY